MIAMYKLIFSILFTVFSLSFAKADLGNALVYYAKFYLNDGSSFKGCFEVNSYESDAYLDENGTNEYCNDKGVYNLLKKLQDQGNHFREDGGIQTEVNYNKIPIYKNIHSISPRSIKKSESQWELTYGFVDINDIVFLDTSDIDKIVFWEAKQSERLWLTSEMVIGTAGMIDTVVHQQYWNSIVVDFEASSEDSLAFGKYEAMWGYRLINYNPNNNVEELKRLANLKFHLRMEEDFLKRFRKNQNLAETETTSVEQDRLAFEARQRYFQSIRLWFWKKGIIMIRVNGTC